MHYAQFLAVLLVLVPSGDASHIKGKYLDKMELLKEILIRYFFVKGPISNLPHTKDVGFLVYSSRDITTTQHAKLQFDRVDRNDGNGYSVKTGIFTSPVAVMYNFFCNFLTLSGGRESTINLMLNGKVKLRSHLAANRLHGTPGGSIYLRLKKGDQVYLQADRSGGKYHNGRHSTFGGELIRY